MKPLKIRLSKEETQFIYEICIIEYMNGKYKSKESCLNLVRVYFNKTKLN